MKNMPMSMAMILEDKKEYLLFPINHLILGFDTVFKQSDCF
jgi:hypothetical protein